MRKSLIPGTPEHAAKREYDAARYKSNADAIRAKVALWAKENKDKKKATDAAYCEKNKESKKLYDIAYHAKNKLKKQKMARDWAKANPTLRSAYNSNRRALKKGSSGTHTAAQIKRLLDSQKGRCPVCKTSLANGYHKDHIKSLSCGGGNDISNIQLLCPICNLKKSTKDPIDFMQQCGFLL